MTITHGEVRCDGCTTRYAGSWAAAIANGWQLAEPDPEHVGEDYCPRCRARREGSRA